MTTRTFTITLDDVDRSMILTALGFASMHLLTGNVPFDTRRPINDLIQRLSSANGQDAPSPQRLTPGESGIEAARAVLSQPPATQPQTKDYFARTKKGDERLDPPDDAELSTVKILSAQQPRGKEYLTVIFAAGVTADGRVRPAGKANCFDKQLWPPIRNREGQNASLWIAESGNYLNIVGVRA